MDRQPTRTTRRSRRAGVVVLCACWAVMIPVGAAQASSNTARSAVTAPAAVVTGVAAPRAGVVPAAASPHGPYNSMKTDSCAGCHRAHTATSIDLLPQASPQSTLCFTCHDGTGATANVESQYTDPSVAANDPSDPTAPGYSASFYRHDATVTTSHVLGSNDEFGGVLNRHTECSDCHDPHQTAAVDATTPAADVAWPLSGRLTGVSGVAVSNGTAGSTPSYTFLDGKATKVSFEYQLCFKCHSGYTNLLSNSGVQPSQNMTDVAVEFNPANASTHPVEGPGTNATQKMKDSLAGTWTGKLWTFSVDGANGVPNTVRCTNCHASSKSAVAGDPGADLSPHTSGYRGLLIRNYRDRELLSSSESYSDNDFALCYTCHNPAPFNSDTSTATNFSDHFKHMTDVKGSGTSSTSIDVAGAGAGHAICAECHFTLHSTATAASPYTRLVNFGPNVTPYNGVLAWTSTSEGHGTCTLVCHGKRHDGTSY